MLVGDYRFQVGHSQARLAGFRLVQDGGFLRCCFFAQQKLNNFGNRQTLELDWHVWKAGLNASTVEALTGPLSPNWNWRQVAGIPAVAVQPQETFLRVHRQAQG